MYVNKEFIIPQKTSKSNCHHHRALGYVGAMTGSSLELISAPALPLATKHLPGLFFYTLWLTKYGMKVLENDHMKAPVTNGLGSGH